MVKMVSMKETKTERKADDKSLAGAPLAANDGVMLHLEHHHLAHMGIDGTLPHGTAINFAGKGEVRSSGTHNGPDGPRHHMTIALHKAGMEEADGPDDKRDALRGDIARATEAPAKTKAKK
jgi:hypothetical protein